MNSPLTNPVKPSDEYCRAELRLSHSDSVGTDVQSSCVSVALATCNIPWPEALH